jgi:NAD(P)-dependent dehydrogenase (short-subunit alcohol dehydrogenase family)
MLISQSNLQQGTLKGDVAIVTGGGRGIGYEAERALLWLGADVVIAEINEGNGKVAEVNLQREFGKDRALFVKTDVGSDGDVDKLVTEILEKRGKIDIVLNNATVFPIGTVKDLTIDKWDFSYR